MGIGTGSNFKIYSPQFWGGVIEVLQQETAVFNANSASMLRMVTRSIKGNYETESFLKYTSGLISPRDPDTMGDVTDINLAQGEFVGVKINRRIGPIAHSRDSFKKQGFDPGVFSMQVGQQVGYEIASDYADAAISAVRAGIKGVAALVSDNTGQTTATLNHGAIVKAMAKFGDRSSRLVGMVMHSKPYFDLVGQAITDKVVNVADVVLYGGLPATLGKPVIVTDSPSLLNKDASGNITSYDVLLLTQDSCELAESEDRDIESQSVLGKENLAIRIQGEHAFNLRVKGCAWDITNGGKNPSNTALATSSNWDKVCNDNKQMPGVVLTVS